MRILRTTDGRFIGHQTELPKRRSVLEINGHKIPIAFVYMVETLAIAGNPNYIIIFEQE
jgi:hypothetical protein